MFSGDKTFLLIMLGVMAAGFLLLVLSHLRRNRLRRIGIPAVADVADVRIERVLRSDATDHDWTDAADRFINKRKYTYTLYYVVGENTYTREIVRESDEQDYGQGESVDILYNPNNPKDMMTAMEVNAGASSLVAVFPVFAIALAIILFFLFKN